MQQMKEQGKNPPDQTNEEEISSLPEKKIQSNDSKDDRKILEIKWRKHKKHLTRTWKN